MWPQVTVIYDECCPIDTAYLIDKNMMVVGIQMSKRTWWKPWTWRRHQLKFEERFPMLSTPTDGDDWHATFKSYGELTWGKRRSGVSFDSE